MRVSIWICECAFWLGKALIVWGLASGLWMVVGDPALPTQRVPGSQAGRPSDTPTASGARRPTLPSRSKAARASFYQSLLVCDAPPVRFSPYASVKYSVLNVDTRYGVVAEYGPFPSSLTAPTQINGANELG